MNVNICQKVVMMRIFLKMPKSGGEIEEEDSNKIAHIEAIQALKIVLE